MLSPAAISEVDTLTVRRPGPRDDGLLWRYRRGDADELVEFWTLLDTDRDLLVGKRGATALGFALLLKCPGLLNMSPAPN